MKPIHLNLAARPFRDYRPVYAVVVVTSLLIAVMMLNNVDTYYLYVTETKSTRAKIAALEKETEQEQRRADDINARLKAVDTKRLASQTQFVNAQLAERAFSWSELLDRLEKVLPDDVRLHNVAPTFGKSGLVRLDLDCDTKTNNGMVNTIVRLTKDPHFANAFPRQESETQNGYTFSVSVDYRPSIARVVQ